VQIPDVAEMSIVDAEKAIEKLKLKVNNTTEEIASEDIEEGLVVKTNPTIGRTVKEGSTITLYISTGMQTYLVEDLSGKNYIEIKTKIEMYDIKVTVEERTVADSTKEYDDQEIIGQSVDPKTELKAGESIILYIPSKEKFYPDIIEEELTVEEVQTWADENEIRLTIVYQETSESPAGTILSQSREADSVVVSGASLQIVVSKEREDSASEEPEEEPTEETAEE
jgi:serine/threonine-protein kinase